MNTPSKIELSLTDAALARAAFEMLKVKHGASVTEAIQQIMGTIASAAELRQAVVRVLDAHKVPAETARAMAEAIVDAVLRSPIAAEEHRDAYTFAIPAPSAAAEPKDPSQN